ncbi:MAG TPA: DEAD/DEAH box helicase, partial [Planctomicrobium sp.]|nr:DEAD/DEAH box helicase [Planctomicrobium sp.]
PKGRLVALTRDELVECMALIRAVRQRRLDVTPIPEAPLDILAQQIVAECALTDWNADDLYECYRNAWPYRYLTREQYEKTLTMLADGLTDTGGRGRSLIYYDRINRQLKGRRAARIQALCNGGAIAEVDTVRVLLDAENTVVGTVDEEFAVESSGGDIFLLGNSSWRIQQLRGNDLLVSDAQGAPPTIPFWRGEAPGRTIELSEEISNLREEVEQRLIAADQQASGSLDDETNEHPVRWKPIAEWLQSETLCDLHSAWQIVIYMAAQRAAIGFLPTQHRVVFERFFDESGGMQLVVHAPFGSRINRGWGLAFRKRFCRSFDFELQATADDDGFILSLGPQHSFPIESLFPMMRTDNARNLLEQALLVVPMFHFRWRWNVTRSLFVSRMNNGKKVAPALQRFRSEDLLTAVFPKLTGCQENIVGDHEIPDHPLVQQTMADCLFEALDIEGLTEVLGRIEAGDIALVGRDTREPSPFAYELLNSNPYAFLDGGEVQERRARAVATRRSLSVEGLRDLGRLDPLAIEQVVTEAQPEIRDEDELHDLLVSRLLVPVWTDSVSSPHPTQQHLQLETNQYGILFQTLRESGRAIEWEYLPGRRAWVAVEAWPAVSALFPDAANGVSVSLPESLKKEWQPVDALMALLRGWIETSGPVTAIQLEELLGLPAARLFATLEAIEGEGLVLRGRFLNVTDDINSQSLEIEWCHRRLLARIHRRTISGLRQEIEAVDPTVYLEFLARHQGAAPGYRKSETDGVHEVISQLQGLDIAAGAWEQNVLPLRVENYRPGWLDELSLSGDVGWGRLEPQAAKKSSGRPMASMTRSIPVSLFLRDDFDWLTTKSRTKDENELSPVAQDLLKKLQAEGALFSSDLCQRLQILPSQLEDLLGELVSAGCLTSDGIAGLRLLIRGTPKEEERRIPGRYRRVRRQTVPQGRWTPLITNEVDASEVDVVEEWAWQLIRRWGVVFRDLLQREPLAPAWWELLRVYRRLEARGELRGGRFIRGVGGEQFATSDAVRELRTIRRSEEAGDLFTISGADPLNLTGVIGPGKRIPALTTHQIAYRRGEVVGWKKADEHWISPGLPVPLQQQLAANWGLTFSTSATPVLAENNEKAILEQEPAIKKRRSPVRSGIPKPFPF